MVTGILYRCGDGLIKRNYAHRAASGSVFLDKGVVAFLSYERAVIVVNVIDHSVGLADGYEGREHKVRKVGVARGGDLDKNYGAVGSAEVIVAVSIVKYDGEVRIGDVKVDERVVKQAVVLSKSRGSVDIGIAHFGYVVSYALDNDNGVLCGLRAYAENELSGTARSGVDAAVGNGDLKRAVNYIGKIVCLNEMNGTVVAELCALAGEAINAASFGCEEEIGHFCTVDGYVGRAVGNRLCTVLCTALKHIVRHNAKAPIALAILVIVYVLVAGHIHSM